MGVRVAITGVGIHPFGRHEGVSNMQMGVHAVRAALDEAGNPRVPSRVLRNGVRRCRVGPQGAGRARATGMPIVDIEAGCASGGAALQLAAGAIRAGQYDCALVFGVEKMPKGIIRSSFFDPWREQAGLAATPAYFALRAQRLLREAGPHQGASRAGRREEPRLRRRESQRDVPQGGDRRAGTRITIGVRAAAPLDVVLPQRGGGRDRAPTRRQGNGITLASARLRSHLPGSVLGEATPLSGIDDTGITPPSTLAARDAYEEAGIGPGDLDVVECQDTDAARELLAYQELDLCAPGEQARFLAEPTVAVNSQRRAVVEGRTARCIGARPGRGARAPTARRRGRASGRGRTRGARPHRRPRRQRQLRDRDGLKPPPKCWPSFGLATFRPQRALTNPTVGAFGPRRTVFRQTFAKQLRS